MDTFSMDMVNNGSEGTLDSIARDNLEQLFDVFSECIEGRYLFVEYIPEGISRWSREAVEHFALPSTHIRDGARVWGERIIEHERSSYLEQIVSLEKGESATLDYITRVKNAEGLYQTVGCKARLINDYEGRPLFFVGSIMDYEKLDTIDPVTGLFSRNNLISTIEHYLKEQKPFVVSSVGIRNFFDFNSSYGFDEGNRLLKKVADWLSQKKKNGVFFRTEGTKFAYVVEDSGHTYGELHELFDGLKAMLRNDIYVNGIHAELNLCGGAMHVTDMSLDAASVYNSVQYVLAQAKAENRMELLVYDEEMQNKSRAHLNTLNKLRSDAAAGCKGFFLVYQPIVSAVDEKLTGMEALIRYRDENGRVIPPSDFITWLEKDVVYYELGKFILRTAMNDAKKIIDEIPDFIVNVNLAYPQLQRIEFKMDLKKLIDEGGYDTKNLKLELTERCRLLDMDSLRNDMVYFKSSGIQTALDDFGTGYSALGLLVNLPVDQIKIDRTFVDGIENDVPRQCLLEAITDCAAKLGVNCCIEGVETGEMKDYLKANYRVTSFQGYYYAKPMGIEDFMDWMKKYEGKRP
ncbi:MAG: EAL domain-containing protein [Lachnospiraceae bacterium]|nr:EAL domain-containing protein [Lachnospiraceae bacterium]